MLLCNNLKGSTFCVGSVFSNAKMAGKTRKLMKSIYFFSDRSLRKQNRALKKINQSRIIRQETNVMIIQSGQTANDSSC